MVTILQLYKKLIPKIIKTNVYQRSSSDAHSKVEAMGHKNYPY